jgi:hypothetical protein
LPLPAVARRRKLPCCTRIRVCAGTTRVHIYWQSASETKAAARATRWGLLGAWCGRLCGGSPPPPPPPLCLLPPSAPFLGSADTTAHSEKGGLSPQKLGDFCSVYPSSPSPLALTITLLTAPAVGVQVYNANTCATKGCTAAATCLGTDNRCYTFSKNDCVARGFCWCGECPSSGYCPLPMR